MPYGIIKRILVVALLITVCCVALAIFVNKPPDPQNTIDAFQNAVNDFDIDAFLGCIDSQWANQIESLLNTSIGVDGLTANSFITLVKTVMPVLPYVTDGGIDADDFPKISLVIQEETISDDEAEVVLSGVITWGKYHKPFGATVNMKIENKNWVICGIR